jgi:sugar lactone lactonase YvrE
MRKFNLLVLTSLLAVGMSSCSKSDIQPDPSIPFAVTTLAGSGTGAFANGTGAAAKFKNPKGIAADEAGNIYVADYGNNRIRKITPGGTVSTFAGSSIAGSEDGLGKAATFNHPYGIAVDASGNVYVSDNGGSLIRKITSDGLVSTFIENTSATGLATDASGNLYVADAIGNVIVKITPAGVIDTLAGDPLSFGAEDGTGADATFNNPLGVAVDASGNVYVADNNNSTIRKITPSKVVSTIAGSGTAGFLDATGTSAVFANPTSLAVDASGNLYVADMTNNRIRKITAAGVVTTLAGSGVVGFTNGIGTSATFDMPTGITILNGSGNLYVTDNGNNAIRKIIN